MPLISIIIPNYNHAPFLQQRLDSVLNQTFQDFELIILDDCSTDKSREIIEEYRDHQRISQIIYNHQNSGGIFKQWIKGINAAKGKYIWIAESDDYADIKFLEETANILATDPNVGLIFTGCTAVDEHGTVIGVTNETKRGLYTQLAACNNRVTKNNVASFFIADMAIENASSVLFRTEILKLLNFAELAKFNNTGDRFVYIGMALHSDIYYLTHPLNYMRSHANNTTKTNVANGSIHSDRLRVLNFYYEVLAETDINKTETTKFYKNNYLSFAIYGISTDHIALLKKMREAKAISNTFYQLVMGYLNAIRKSKNKPSFLRSFFYRLLLLQHRFDKELQI